MNDEAKRADQTRSPGEASTGRIVEIELADVDAVRARGTRPRSGQMPPGLGRDAAIRRLGGRRWLRPELALLLLASVFVVAGLVKPWPNPVRTGSPSPIAAASPTASLASSASVAVDPSPSASYPYVAPYNYRGPHGERQPSPTPPGVTPNPTTPWPAVDWGVLSSTDSHSAWGFATAAMPNGISGPGATVPYESWIDAGTPPKYAAVFLPKGRNVYAIAITWPEALVVTAIKVVYLGPPESPAYVPPDGYTPGAEVIPLPAGPVASSSPAANGAIGSGAFWIPPPEVTTAESSATIRTAWQASPWPWPYGAYQITVKSANGAQNIVLDLEPTF